MIEIRPTARRTLGLAVLFSLLFPALLLAPLQARAVQNGDDAGSVDSSPQSFEITATDFKFDPESITARPAPSSFTVRNVGVIEHELSIETPQRRLLGSTGVLGPGQSGQFSVTLSEGAYVLVCSLLGHREAGMVGTLSVGS